MCMSEVIIRKNHTPWDGECVINKDGIKDAE